MSQEKNKGERILQLNTVVRTRLACARRAERQRLLSVTEPPKKRDPNYSGPLIQPHLLSDTFTNNFLQYSATKLTLSAATVKRASASAWATIPSSSSNLGLRKYNLPPTRHHTKHLSRHLHLLPRPLTVAQYLKDTHQLLRQATRLRLPQATPLTRTLALQSIRHLQRRIL